MGWTAKPIKTLLSRLGDAGFVVDTRMREGLAEMLERSNGDRVDGALAATDLLQTLLDALGSHDEVAFRVAPGDGPTLTACLVTRANYERWVVGVTTCEATRSITSGLRRMEAGEVEGRRRQQQAARELGDEVRPRQARRQLHAQGHQGRVDHEAGSRPRARAPRSDHRCAADDGPRLVYADWLAARDPPRSEFIVLQCQAETLRGKQRAALEKRATELLAAHSARWYPAWCSITYRRGFPYAISTEIEPLLLKGPKLFSVTPLDYIALECHMIKDIGRFATFSKLERITTLELNSMHFNVESMIEELGRTKGLGGITTLVLRGGELTPAAAALLANPTTLPGLLTVRTDNMMPAPARRALAARNPLELALL